MIAGSQNNMELERNGWNIDEIRSSRIVSVGDEYKVVHYTIHYSFPYVKYFHNNSEIIFVLHGKRLSLHILALNC